MFECINACFGDIYNLMLLSPSPKIDSKKIYFFNQKEYSNTFFK